MGLSPRRRLFALGLLGALGAAACSASETDNDLGGPSTSPADDDDGSSSSGGGQGGSSGRPSSSGAPSSSSGGSGSGGPGSNGSAKPNCKYDAHAAGLTAHQRAAGLTFHTYTAPSYDPEVGHRVVMLMHGQDSNGVPEMNALWKPIADAEDLVLVVPKGTRPATDPGTYPDGGNWATADMNQLVELVAEIDDCFNVDPKRHVLWGFSAGTFYGYLLGIGAAELFSGLAMGGANASFAQQNGYGPADAAWKIPVSHVHGTQDFNPIAQTRQDQAAFEAAGHVFTLHEHSGGHSITAEQVQQQWDDLKDSQSP